MKKLILPISLTIVLIISISWGYKGHRAVATIAQNHLNPKAKSVVSALLGGENMTDLSTWADEHKNPTTSKWHFLNLPLGLNHNQFIEEVNSPGKINIYGAIIKEEAILSDKKSSSEQKNNALKYLIHLVGDAHQPMHVSRAEDKGGNTIQVRFDNGGTNLHSLWDSKLIDHEGLSEDEIAKKYDWANESQIKKWQSSTPMDWLWESYQISSELYADIKPGQKLDDTYYKKYIATIHLRIDQAGIRLAGELNRLFDGTTVPKIVKSDVGSQTGTKYEHVDILAKMEHMPQVTSLTETGKHLNELVATTGKVYGIKDMGNMVFVNLGAAYPNQLLTVILKEGARKLAGQIDDKTITVQGKVVNYKGKPEIVVTDANLVSIDK